MIGGKNLDPELLKFKNLIIERFWIIFLIIGVLLVLSGFWAFKVYTEPVYEIKEVPDSFYIYSANYDYTAKVTESNPIYSVGEELEGKPAYFFSVSPTFDMTFSFEVTSSSPMNLSVESETMVVATASGSNEGKQEIFWQKKFPIHQEKRSSMTSGDAIISDFSVNVSKIQAMVKDVQDQLKYSESTSIEVITYVNYEGQIKEETVNNTLEFPILLTIGSSYYQLPEKLEFTKDIDTYKTYKTKKTPSLSSIKVPLAVFIFSLFLLGVLIPFRNKKKIDPEYIEKLRKEHKIESSFKDLISKGTLPENTENLLQVKITSLKELTDAALDMNARVIRDLKTGIYFIIHDGVLYIYQEEPSQEEVKEEN